MKNVRVISVRATSERCPPLSFFPHLTPRECLFAYYKGEKRHKILNTLNVVLLKAWPRILFSIIYGFVIGTPATIRPLKRLANIVLPYLIIIFRVTKRKIDLRKLY